MSRMPVHMAKNTVLFLFPYPSLDIAFHSVRVLDIFDKKSCSILDGVMPVYTLADGLWHNNLLIEWSSCPVSINPTPATLLNLYRQIIDGSLLSPVHVKVAWGKVNKVRLYGKYLLW